ncbi:MAG: hypothetical protein K2L25_00315 [Alphaproteobacteria bacterium]|nr:hypothetical protein [Alphaproteobacteria bacterium]
MKKFLIFCVVCMPVAAAAIDLPVVKQSCKEDYKKYTRCKVGYYLENESCKRCPSSGGVYGTTVNHNAGDITSCYIPSGTTFSDTSGNGVYEGDCYYKK